MKTIRSNTFETNSSSSHSVTIETKNKLSLRESGIFYPDRLRKTEAYREESDYNESMSCVASSILEKAALFMQHVASYFDDEYEQVEYDESFKSKCLSVISDELKEAGIIKETSFENFKIDFSIHESESRTYMADIFTKNASADTVIQNIRNFMHDVVFKDTKIMNQSSSSY